MLEDFNRINNILLKLGEPKLEPEHFDVYNTFEEYQEKMISAGSYARILVNNRWEPEKIKEIIPPGTKIPGDLDLSGIQITSLPEGLSVGKSLYLSGIPITSLPEGLSVGRSLDLRGTQITSLPEGLSVGGSLYGINPKTNRDYQIEYNEMRQLK